MNIRSLKRRSAKPHTSDLIGLREIKTAELSTYKKSCNSHQTLFPRRGVGSGVVSCPDPTLFEEKGSGEKRQDPWIMTSFVMLLIIITIMKAIEHDTKEIQKHSASWL